MSYRLTMQDRAGALSYLNYDPHTSSLTDEQGIPVPLEYEEKEWHPIAQAISPETPGVKVNNPVRLKIQLGLKCNYSCSYCLQSAEIPDATVSGIADVEEFIANLDSWLVGAPKKIEFWGGEPFVYWAHLKRLVPALADRFPDSEFLIITNGSLMSEEKIDFLERYDIMLGVSHDAMGQHLRGPDPLDEPGTLEIWRELFRRRQGRVGFNCVMTAQNCDIDAITGWLTAKMGMPVPVSFEGVVHSYDTENRENNAGWSKEQYAKFQANIIKAMVNGTVAGHHSSVATRGLNFIDSLKRRRPSSSLGQKCGMDRPDQLSVDLRGNVTTCQNVGAGGKHGIGHVSDMAAVRLDTSLHWSKRPNCGSCPVLQLCSGACMYNEGEDFNQSCENEFQFNSAIMAGALYWATGKLMVEIEGDIKRPKIRKVIHIKQASK